MTKPADSKHAPASAAKAAPAQGRRYNETFKLDAVRMRNQSGNANYHGNNKRSDEIQRMAMDIVDGSFVL